jgi:phosphatidylserine/phosphatidylglycerophosphate/cardiolipin synthase-like enzyme
MRSWKQWSLALMLVVALGQWVWTFVPTPSEARAREGSSSASTAPDHGLAANGAGKGDGQGAGEAVPARVLGVFFTPPTGAGKALVHWIDEARQEVLVQAYGFTHNAIAQALLRAHLRGVRVSVLLDQKSSSTNRYVIDLLQSSQVGLRFDGEHAIAHNKVMVIDQRVVVTGSFNFTNSADTRNAENLLILESPALAARYLANWQNHWAHASSRP